MTGAAWASRAAAYYRRCPGYANDQVELGELQAAARLLLAVEVLPQEAARLQEEAAPQPPAANPQHNHARQ